jgi:Na+/H+ antiporter NhaD/arsenite permease-like protein
MILPFGLLLGLIALAPLSFPNWWRKHYPKVAFSLGLVTLGYYVFGLAAPERVLHTATEYLSFIALIGSLFVVSSGIRIQVKGEATPLANVVFLFIAATAANLLGTTGASMLFIRPWLRMNKYRVTAHHVVFFIFIVSNVGGCLSPIGDPPLFLGYLRGIPFGWVFAHAWQSACYWRCSSSSTGETISARPKRCEPGWPSPRMSGGLKDYPTFCFLRSFWAPFLSISRLFCGKC